MNIPHLDKKNNGNIISSVCMCANTIQKKNYIPSILKNTKDY